MVQDFRAYSDTDLLRIVRAGDERAFGEFFARYWPPMFLHAMRMLQDEAVCQDVVQESFLAFWRRAPQLPLDTRVEAYLYRIVRNRIVKIIAEEKQRSDLLADFSRATPLVEEASDAHVYESELIALINDEVGKMPRRMQEVFRLSRTENLKHREIAERLGISGHTVKSQLNNALRRIKVRIGVLLVMLSFGLGWLFLFTQ